MSEEEMYDSDQKMYQSYCSRLQALLFRAADKAAYGSRWKGFDFLPQIYYNMST